MKGVSLDSLDVEWLSQNPDSCREMMHLDTSAEMIASIQIVIKLQSNGLMFLPYDQLDPNEKLLTEIIHGTFTEQPRRTQCTICHFVVSDIYEADNRLTRDTL